MGHLTVLTFVFNEKRTFSFPFHHMRGLSGVNKQAVVLPWDQSWAFSKLDNLSQSLMSLETDDYSGMLKLTKCKFSYPDPQECQSHSIRFNIPDFSLYWMQI